MKFYEFTNDLKGIRAQCDIGLTCSKAEALGRVTIENMLSSLLVIAGRSAGSEEVVKDKQTGLFYETGSYTSLSEAIVNAIKEPELSNNIVKAGHEEAKLLYDNKKYGKDIIEVYDQLMKSKSEGTMNKHEY